MKRYLSSINSDDCLHFDKNQLELKEFSTLFQFRIIDVPETEKRIKNTLFDALTVNVMSEGRALL